MYLKRASKVSAIKEKTNDYSTNVNELPKKRKNPITMIQQEFPNQNSSLFQFDMPKDQPSIIKVIGVGGGGSNAVNHMFRLGIKGVEFLVCNTDQQALDISPVPTKIQLGPGLTQGRGAGALPEVGKQAAIEIIDELEKVLASNTQMVFITAGMGGGTGTGAAPIIAGIARQMGILTVGIVTIPFQFEGRKRKQQAEAGLEEMKKNVDALLIISNDKLREIYGNLHLSKAFGHADDVLTVAARSIAEVITTTMHVNVDFADIQTVMKDSGVAIMGSSTAEGDNRAVRAAELALDSPLLNDNQIEGARYILLNITSGQSEVTMDEVGEINDYIQAQAGQTAEIILGIGNDPSLGEKISVTVIATGFKTTKDIVNEMKPEQKIIHHLTDEKKNIQPTPVNEIVQVQPEKQEEVKPEETISFNEPVLIIKPEIEIQDEVSFFTTETFNDDSFELEIENHSSEQNADLFVGEITSPLIIDETPAEIIRHNLVDETPKAPEAMPNAEEEMYRRSRERIMRLKELSYKLNSPNDIADLEKEPAYKRRNVKLDNVPESSESNVSRYTLSVDDQEKRPELRTNNSYLHDKVD